MGQHGFTVVSAATWQQEGCGFDSGPGIFLVSTHSPKTFTWDQLETCNCPVEWIIDCVYVALWWTDSSSVWPCLRPQTAEIGSKWHPWLWPEEQAGTENEWMYVVPFIHVQIIFILIDLESRRNNNRKMMDGCQCKCILNSLNFACRVENQIPRGYDWSLTRWKKIWASTLRTTTDSKNGLYELKMTPKMITISITFKVQCFKGYRFHLLHCKSCWKQKIKQQNIQTVCRVFFTVIESRYKLDRDLCKSNNKKKN